MKKYYYAGGARVAIRTGTANPKWLLLDHLGSQAYTVSYDGLTEEGEVRYKPWGGDRYTSGTTPTSFRFTGQRSEMGGIGLYYYGARWYDPYLSRFISADTLIPNPGDPVAWDRYAYGRNSPARYTDPSGHWYYDPGCDCIVYTKEPGNQYPRNLTYVNTADTLSFVDGSYQEGEYRVQVPDNKYGFPDQPDYRSFSIYFGQFGSFLELLLAQLEPTPFTEALSPLVGLWISAGVTITVDKYGRVYIAPGTAFGRTMVTYPIFGLPSVSYTFGYIERGELFGPEGNATKEELDSLLRGGSRSHGFCGPIFPCIFKSYSLTSSVNAWEWGFGTPFINFLTILLGFGP